MATTYVGDNGPDGVGLGKTSTTKVGLWGATPVVQAATTTAPASTAATNSSPYGYSQAQADAIVTWIRAMDTALKNAGIVAAS